MDVVLYNCIERLRQTCVATENSYSLLSLLKLCVSGASKAEFVTGNDPVTDARKIVEVNGELNLSPVELGAFHSAWEDVIKIPGITQPAITTEALMLHNGQTLIRFEFAVGLKSEEWIQHNGENSPLSENDACKVRLRTDEIVRGNAKDFRWHWMSRRTEDHIVEYCKVDVEASPVSIIVNCVHQIFMFTRASKTHALAIGNEVMPKLNYMLPPHCSPESPTSSYLVDRRLYSLLDAICRPVV